MTGRRVAFAFLGTSLISSQCFASGWQITGAGNGRGEMMTLPIDKGRSYIFECASDAVVITNTGATDLLDIRGGGKVSDAPGSKMPEGAAVMAVFTGKGEPEFGPAEYKASALQGWDLTLKLPKDDKRLKALEKAKMLSLFTTGYTAARELDAGDRAQFSGFLARCRA